MLLGLLLKWVVIGSPHYPGMKGGQTIPYVLLLDPRVVYLSGDTTPKDLLGPHYIVC